MHVVTGLRVAGPIYFLACTIPCPEEGKGVEFLMDTQSNVGDFLVTQRVFS